MSLEAKVIPFTPKPVIDTGIENGVEPTSAKYPLTPFAIVNLLDQPNPAMVAAIKTALGYPFVSIGKVENTVTLTIEDQAELVKTVNHQKRFGNVNPLLQFLFTRNVDTLKFEYTGNRLALVADELVVKSFESVVGVNNVAEVIKNRSQTSAAKIFPMTLSSLAA